MNKSVIVCGEASETDSEDEGTTNALKLVKPIQGALITGEDSESENENDGSIASAVSALNITQEAPNQNTDKYDSLLHLKLKESNIKLQQDHQTFVENTINEAEKNLNSIDQGLIKSQLTLQAAVTSLKTLGTSSMTIRSKLLSLLSSQFLSNINVNNCK